MTDDLECRAVVKRFGAFTAVDGVSFTVPQGSFFSILGPSGCGKTSLLRMIAGFAEPDGGEILIGGRSMRGVPPNRRPACMVFQHLALFPMMSVAGNIGYGLRRRGLGRADIDRRVRDVLARIGLPESGGKRIDQLSGGQKQRVAIARCMVLEPTVLLLDEPLGALDLKLREHMKLELKQVQRQFGTTFVYITHDQSEALVMSDRVAVMNAGRFDQVADPRTLYHRPATPFVAGFVGDSHRWTGHAMPAPGGCTVKTESGLVLDAAVSQSGPVTLFVRPEAILLQTACEGEGLAGVVEAVLFNGANSRAMVRLLSGELLAAALPVSVAVAPGMGVRLTIAPSDVMVFAGHAA